MQTRMANLPMRPMRDAEDAGDSDAVISWAADDGGDGNGDDGDDDDNGDGEDGVDGGNILTVWHYALASLQMFDVRGSGTTPSQNPKYPPTPPSGRACEISCKLNAQYK